MMSYLIDMDERAFPAAFTVSLLTVPFVSSLVLGGYSPFLCTALLFLVPTITMTLCAFLADKVFEMAKHDARGIISARAKYLLLGVAIHPDQRMLG